MHPTRVVEHLSCDLTRSLIPFEFDNDEIAGRIYAQQIKGATEVSWHLTPNYQQVVARDRYVLLKPVFDATFKIKVIVSDFSKRIIRGYFPKANLLWHDWLVG